MCHTLCHRPAELGCCGPPLAGVCIPCPAPGARPSSAVPKQQPHIMGDRRSCGGRVVEHTPLEGAIEQERVQGVVDAVAAGLRERLDAVLGPDCPEGGCGSGEVVELGQEPVDSYELPDGAGRIAFGVGSHACHDPLAEPLADVAERAACGPRGAPNRPFLDAHRESRIARRCGLSSRLSTRATVSTATRPDRGDGQPCNSGTAALTRGLRYAAGAAAADRRTSTARPPRGPLLVACIGSRRPRIGETERWLSYVASDEPEPVLSAVCAAPSVRRRRGFGDGRFV